MPLDTPYTTRRLRAVVLACCALSAGGAWAQDASMERSDAPAVPAPSPSAARSSGALDLGPAVLKSAIDAADADYARTDTRSTFGAVTPSRGVVVEQDFKAAEIDTCGKPSGAFRFDPPVIGPVPLGGLLVAPFWLHAITSGRCRM